MKLMTNGSEHDWGDERMGELFSMLHHSAPPPDAALLEELRERSTVVFTQQFHASRRNTQRSRKMMMVLTRTLAAAAAALAMLASWFFVQRDGETGPQLEVVLARLSQAESLHLQLVRDGTSSDIYTRRPTQLRWNLPDGTYRIDDGQHLWQVDEQANRAVSEPSQFFAAAPSGLDALRLMDVIDPQLRQALLALRPAEQVTTEGIVCDVYRWPTDSVTSDMHMVAYVAAQDNLLRSLEITVGGAGRNVSSCKLAVAAVNPPLDEQLFRIADTLTADGRIGKVLDAQGLVSVQPLGHHRWTPVQPGLVLKPGDWVRSDLRGANAATLRLVPHSLVTLGPGTLVELKSPTDLAVVAGELKLITDPAEPVRLHGAADQSLEVRGTQWVRRQDDTLVTLQREPAWVAGYEGTTVDESIGSLVAKIDGRDVPLTVGYHKVTVDIRDQIARTVIEESFVNHTANRLEGVFYFPLPQDASISGFGMWIGDELVEADVVEKQRAREIYETILREKRDPGLLEWTGGNQFKARIFPIEAHAQKRITITYTQVLPLRGNQFRYSYALQSEMLRQHPLSTLSIGVKINSQVPIASVTSPTHTARIAQTEHSGSVEFSAQEFTPDHDFEVVVQLQDQPATAVLIPHQRGDNGYFMLQVMPPVIDSAADRDLLPDGEPLELLLVADTSASMDEPSRQTQAELITAILTSLSDQDSFNLMMCDVNCHWLFDEPVPADAGNVALAMSSLGQRVSLGWTDLDKAFREASARVTPRTQLIYLGDGIVTGPDADPVACAKRLRQQFQGLAGTGRAIAVSSRYESTVLKAIASLGRGSLRKIDAQQNAQQAARELLAEMTRPATTISQIELRGLRTARVYPEELPNLADGTQQILVGRYLPQQQDVRGEVVIAATRGGTPLQISSPFQLKQAEEGNSFIPRLWARMHLDALLEQGTSQTIQDEVISLSEEFHIITPYTSLLVLESDADRERFQVQRRFQMRDGERFFAAGRDNANYELLQQQMRRAGDWRIQLRMDVLRELNRLGRSPLSPGGSFAKGRSSGKGGDIVSVMWDGSSSTVVSSSWAADNSRRNWGFSTNGFGGGRRSDLAVGFNLPGSSVERYAVEIMDFESADKAEWFQGGDRFGRDFVDNRAASFGEEDVLESTDFSGRLEFGQLAKHGKPLGGKRLDSLFSSAAGEPEVMLRAKFKRLPARVQLWDTDGADLYGENGVVAFGSYFARQERILDGAGTLTALFPQLPAIPVRSAAKPGASDWPEEARQISDSLLRQAMLQSVSQPLEITRTVQSFDPRWNSRASQQQITYLLSSNAWLATTLSVGGQTLVHSCDSERRQVFSRAFLLGRRRAATPEELRNPPLDVSGFIMTSLEQTYGSYQVEVRQEEASRVRLNLTHPTNADYQMQLVIDTEKNVLLRFENWQDGKVVSAQQYGDFVLVADAWFAGTCETLDEQGRRSGLVTQKFTELSADEFAARWAQEQTGDERVLWIREPLPQLPIARQAVERGKADFTDQLVILLHDAQLQKWDRVLQQLAVMESIFVGKPGLTWVRDAVMLAARRREELRQRVLDRAANLAQPTDDGPVVDEYFLANHLVSQASGICEANEMLTLLDKLEPVFSRQPDYVQARLQCQQHRIGYLLQVDRAVEALELRKQLAESYPHQESVQREYAQSLIDAGEVDQAVAWISQVLTPAAQWYPHESASLRNIIVQYYRSQGRYPDLVEYLQQWIGAEPETDSTYDQYLTALAKNDQLEQASDQIAVWLTAGAAADPLSKTQASQLRAAVQHALGQGYDLGTNRLDPRWLEPLAAIVATYVRQTRDNDVVRAAIADTIMNSYPFRETDVAARTRREIVPVIAENLTSLAFPRLQRMVNWIWTESETAGTEFWQSVAQELRRRWEAEKIAQRRHELGTLLGQVLSGKMDAASYLQFLREQWRKGPELYRDQYAETLFNTLLGQSWSQEVEDEVAAMVPQLQLSAEPVDRLQRQVAAIYQLTDTMVANRFQALMGDVKNQSQLSRTELRDLQANRMRQAQQGYAEQLDRRTRQASVELVGWMNAEWTYLQLQLNENLDQVVQRCWEFLGGEPVRLDADIAADQLDVVLRYRYLMTLANLAARRSAQPELVERLLQYADQAVRRGSDDATAWQAYQYQLLLAVDQTKQLMTRLNEWIVSDNAWASQWRLSLAYLLAEQGKFDEAIPLFEQLQADDLLSSADLQTLADWYLVVDQREKHEQALRASFEMLDAASLYSWLESQLQSMAEPGPSDPFVGRRQQSGVPREMDGNVPLVWEILLAKSSDPANQLHLLRAFYRQTHDFRLLTALADAVIGHTAGEIFPFLSQVSGVLSDVRDEATSDQLAAHLTQIRERATTVVDQRAVDLLEMLVQRRAAELLNQPGPHAEEALTAMQRAMKAQWNPGEQRLIADLLASLGAISVKDVAAEQLRQLQLLRRGAAPGSTDELHLAWRLAQAYWAYGRQDDALDELEAALREVQAAAGQEGLPLSANEPLSCFVDYLASTGRYVQAEKVLTTQSQHTKQSLRRWWLTDQRYQLYLRALQADGEVSLGRGNALYRKLTDQLQEALQSQDWNQPQQQQLIYRLVEVYRAAKEKHLGGPADDVVEFAQQGLPEALKRQVNSYHSVVGHVAHAIADLAEPRAALAFLIAAIENEPRWFALVRQDGWNEHAYRLGMWREQVKRLGNLEAPLLEIVTRELRRDLESREQRSRIIYWRPQQYFWEAQAEAFLRTAETVYAQRKQSGESVKYIAEYVAVGLDRHDRAIEMLITADRDGVLDAAGKYQLAEYFHITQRYEESIPVLQPLVEQHPDVMAYRTKLMHAYFRTHRQQQLADLLDQTDARLHERDLWNEDNLSQLAASCLENQLYERAVKYYTELITLHKRTQPVQSRGDGRLSDFCQALARAHAGLGDTAAAVDAASEGVVTWGPDQSQRTHALDTLRDVVRSSRNLDAFVKQLDQETEETGLDKPIVRQAIARVYMEKKEYAAAAKQLRLAVSLRGNDAETRRQLIECYDHSGDVQGAIQQYLALIELNPHDRDNYRALAHRFEKAGQGDEAERTYTSIVEALAQEAEGHQMLAEIRQDQGRWAEAAQQWQQVAALRPLEPTGWLGLAKAQVLLEQWDEARQTLDRLRSRSWPDRFTQLQTEIDQLWHLVQKELQGRSQ